MKNKGNPPKVTNYRKNGEVFDPRGFRVPRKGNEAAYSILERAKRGEGE